MNIGRQTHYKFLWCPKCRASKGHREEDRIALDHEGRELVVYMCLTCGVSQTKVEYRGKE